MFENAPFYDGRGLVNVTKKVLIEEMNKHLPKLDCCHCDTCIDDIAALSLQQLPPHYVTNILDVKKSLAQLDRKVFYRVMVKAIQKVHDTPHH